MQTIEVGLTENIIPRLLSNMEFQRLFLVHGASFSFLSINNTLSNARIPSVSFDGFTSNPLYEDVCRGVALFRASGCDAIIAVGGGSSIDVAKCIKLFCGMEGNGSNGEFLRQPFVDSDIPLFAIPTTAGTGSESTRYAVIYHEGKKQSITHDSIIPNYALLDASLLKILPLYQKKCSLLDAICQGIESWWSINSTPDSKMFSKMAIEAIVLYMDAYLNDNDNKAAEAILLAANYAGRAISITQTTAVHAMSYKLTSMYNLPHGHAVAICFPYVWAYMLEHPEDCIDPRSKNYMMNTFREIAAALGCTSPQEAIKYFQRLLKRLGITQPTSKNWQDLNVLTESVNPTRLRNNPVQLNKKALYNIYQKVIMIGKQKEE